MDHEFLFAMVEDDGESNLREIATRLNVDIKYASVYRRRLIRSGMIIPTGRGRINLAHHAARDWIRRKAAQDWNRIRL